jgi:plasmid maintenance system antidote protein VapI
MTAETAVRLGLAFGVDPQFWLNLQAQYDIEVVQREQGARLSEEVHELAAQRTLMFRPFDVLD